MQCEPRARTQRAQARSARIHLRGSRGTRGTRGLFNYACACELHGFRGGTMRGVGAEGKGLE